MEHKFRTSAIATNKGDYPEKIDGSEERFSTLNVPITSIAVSTGQNDSGVFELNFRDERYMPFEGAGAISKWRIELPDMLREFDYGSITDVVMHLRYTSLGGGDKLRAAAAGWVDDYVKGLVDLSQDEGLFALFDLRHDFPNEWCKVTNPPPGATERIMNLALQLHFDMSAPCCGLMSSSPERPCDDELWSDAFARKACRDAADFLYRPADQRMRFQRRGFVGSCALFLGAGAASVGVNADRGHHGEGQHDERDVTVPAMPGAGLVVVEAEFVLGGFEAVFDRPAMAFDFRQSFDAGSGRATMS